MICGRTRRVGLMRFSVLSTGGVALYAVAAVVLTACTGLAAERAAQRQSGGGQSGR